MTKYVEEVKKRILNGNLEKPECLYPLLIKELDEEKRNEVIPWLKSNTSGHSVVDLGGGSGEMIKDLDFKTKVVIDKRIFNWQKGVVYVTDDFTSKNKDYTLYKDLTIISEVLHLLSHEARVDLLGRINSDELIVIENKWDDFLDLRLRLWSEGGSCLKSEYISELLGSVPVASTSKHLIWRINNGGN